MPSILIVERLGSIKPLNVKKYVEEELFKKAGFKSPNGFVCHTTWKIEVANKKFNISLYGKLNGKVNQENKYDFPPPIDKLLFFGNCILVNKNEIEDGIDLTPKEWDACYEHLFGGFEDIGEEDSEEEEDIDSIEIDPAVKRTKTGYIKDDFIVDDDEMDSDEYDDGDNEDDDDNVVSRVLVKKAVKPTVKKERKSNKSAFEHHVIEPTPVVEEFLDCTSELSEESYIEE
jgi:hypothetical protein